MSLQDRDQELEQRAREVSALNQLLQQHLLEWYKVAQEYRGVLAGIREMLSGEGEISLVQSVELGELIDSVVAGESAASTVDGFGIDVSSIQHGPVPVGAAPSADTSFYA